MHEEGLLVQKTVQIIRSENKKDAENAIGRDLAMTVKEGSKEKVSKD